MLCSLKIDGFVKALKCLRSYILCWRKRIPRRQNRILLPLAVMRRSCPRRDQEVCALGEGYYPSWENVLFPRANTRGQALLARHLQGDYLAGADGRNQLALAAPVPSLFCSALVFYQSPDVPSENHARGEHFADSCRLMVAPLEIDQICQGGSF